MADWLWYFVFYSFVGYLLEKWFAHRTHAAKQTRKCFLLLPLCPVYGLALTAVLALPPRLLRFPWILLSGGAVTTAVEYAVHWAYETLLGVRFWDYSRVWGNLNGRVCLPFTLVWGVLTAVAVLAVQPGIAWLIRRIPPAATYGMLLLLTADAVCSAFFLARTGDTEGLRLWRRGAA